MKKTKLDEDELEKYDRIIRKKSMCLLPLQLFFFKLKK